MSNSIQLPKRFDLAMKRRTKMIAQVVLVIFAVAIVRHLYGMLMGVGRLVHYLVGGAGASHIGSELVFLVVGLVLLCALVFVVGFMRRFLTPDGYVEFDDEGMTMHGWISFKTPWSNIVRAEQTKILGIPHVGVEFSHIDKVEETNNLRADRDSLIYFVSQIVLYPFREWGPQKLAALIEFNTPTSMTKYLSLMRSTRLLRGYDIIIDTLSTDRLSDLEAVIASRAAGPASSEPPPPQSETEDDIAPEAAEDEDRIPCPQCAEMIMARAKICRFCGSAVDGQPTEESVGPTANEASLPTPPPPPPSFS